MDSPIIELWAFPPWLLRVSKEAYLSSSASLVTRALCADRAEASGNGGPAVILEGPEAPKAAVGVYWTTGDTMNETKLAGAVCPVVRNRRMRNRTSGGVGGRRG